MILKDPLDPDVLSQLVYCWETRTGERISATIWAADSALDREISGWEWRTHVSKVQGGRDEIVYEGIPVALIGLRFSGFEEDLDEAIKRVVEAYNRVEELLLL